LLVSIQLYILNSSWNTTSPTGSEIGVLILGGERDGNDFEPANRDIVIPLKGPGNTLLRINELNQFYDPLQYVLMFPEGDTGWHCDCRIQAYIHRL
jgi:hypothetical protein